MGVMCLNMKCTAHAQKCKTRTRNISSERAWWRMTGRKCRTWQHIDKLALTLSVCMCLDNRCLCSECVCVLVASTGEMPVCREVALTCFNTLHIPALFQHTSIERHIQRYTDKHCTHSHSQTHTHTHMFTHVQLGIKATHSPFFCSSTLKNTGEITEANLSTLTAATRTRGETFPH